MDTKNIYLVKYNTKKFTKHILVKFITCINDSYLVADLNDNSNREWVDCSEVYPVDWSIQNYKANYKFNAELQAIADELLNK